MEQRKENRMGTMPVSKLLVSMALPIVLSMLVQAMYNIVDSIFVARIGENALTAVSLAFPVQNLMISVGVGTGIGINSLLSRRLGERKFEEANATANNGFFLAVISGIAFALLGIFASQPFFRAFTDNTEIISMGTEYLTICMLFSFGVFIQITGERVMQASGNTFYNMIIQGTGAIVNIILDPIFIFGWFGVPKMGVQGAAVATVIGQMVGMSLGILFNVTRNKEVKLKIKGFRPDLAIIKEIYKVGVPSILMQSLASVMIFGVNQILIQFTETAVSVFGVYFKLQSFIFMPVFGVTSGLIPIVAYNFGARKKERIVHAIKDALIYVSVIMAAGVLAFWIFPSQLLGMFQASPAMLEIGIPALRIISISFMGAGVAIVFSSVFQALGNGILSLIMSLARQIFIILPVAWLMANYIGLHAVWFSFPIAEIASFSMAILMYRWIYNRHIKELKPLNEET